MDFDAEPRGGIRDSTVRDRSLYEGRTRDGVSRDERTPDDTVRDGGRLTMSVEGSRDRVVIRMRGELDTMGRLKFREQIRSLLGRGGSEVVVDVGDLDGINVAGLAALLRADLLLRGVHSHLFVRGAGPAFVDLLRTTGLEGRLHVDPAVPATG